MGKYNLYKYKNYFAYYIPERERDVTHQVMDRLCKRWVCAYLDVFSAQVILTPKQTRRS